LSLVSDYRVLPHSNTIGPLEPGLMVRMNIVLIQRPSNETLSALNTRLCGAVWNLSDPVNAERCYWQIWVELAEGANGEVWDDRLRAWTAMGSDGFGQVQGTMGFWTVAVTMLIESNSNASLARHKINSEVNSAAFLKSKGLHGVIVYQQKTGRLYQAFLVRFSSPVEFQCQEKNHVDLIR